MSRLYVDSALTRDVGLAAKQQEERAQLKAAASEEGSGRGRQKSDLKGDPTGYEAI